MADDAYEPSQADIHWLHTNGDHVGTVQQRQLRVVTLDEFVAVTDDVVDPLVGTPDETLVPVDGTLLMYGDGGAGKTTLSIDALAHFAAGVSWLGITVARPVRTLLIENEGPRGPFRKRLADKVSTWHGPAFTSNVAVLEEPWTRFTLTEPTYRAALAQQINERGTELVIVGPLASLGAKGTGTPDEINEFDAHVLDLRAQAQRPFALWIVHHENKAGDVSGAWERYPDTLVHVQAQGNGRTRVYWRKVRWSSSLHDTSSNLIWAEGSSFTLEEQENRDYQAELHTAFTASDAWRTLAEAKELIGAKDVKTHAALEALVAIGEFQYMKGPPGRSPRAQCWRLSTNPTARGQSGLVAPPEGLTRSTDPLTPPFREGEKGTVVAEPAGTHPPGRGQFDVYDPAVQAMLDDDIPF